MKRAPAATQGALVAILLLYALALAVHGYAQTPEDYADTGCWIVSINPGLDQLEVDAQTAELVQASAVPQASIVVTRAFQPIPPEVKWMQLVQAQADGDEERLVAETEVKTRRVSMNHWLPDNDLLPGRQYRYLVRILDEQRQITTTLGPIDFQAPPAVQLTCRFREDVLDVAWTLVGVDNHAELEGRLQSGLAVDGALFLAPPQSGVQGRQTLPRSYCSKNIGFRVLGAVTTAVWTPWNSSQTSVTSLAASGLYIKNILDAFGVTAPANTTQRDQRVDDFRLIDSDEAFCLLPGLHADVSVESKSAAGWRRCDAFRVLHIDVPENGAPFVQTSASAGSKWNDLIVRHLPPGEWTSVQWRSEPVIRNQLRNDLFRVTTPSHEPLLFSVLGYRGEGNFGRVSANDFGSANNFLTGLRCTGRSAEAVELSWPAMQYSAADWLDGPYWVVSRIDDAVPDSLSMELRQEVFRAAITQTSWRDTDVIAGRSYRYAMELVGIVKSHDYFPAFGCIEVAQQVRLRSWDNWCRVPIPPRAAPVVAVSSTEDVDVKLLTAIMEHLRKYECQLVERDDLAGVRREEEMLREGFIANSDAAPATVLAADFTVAVKIMYQGELQFTITHHRKEPRTIRYMNPVRTEDDLAALLTRLSQNLGLWPGQPLPKIWFGLRLPILTG